MPTNRLGQSMTEWSTRLSQFGASDIAAQIDEPKLVSIRRLQDSGLPCAESSIMEVPQFMADTERYFHKLNMLRFFAILSPHDTKLRRYRQGRLEQQDVTPFIEATLPETQYQKYNLILQAAYKYYYGGNVVCGVDGSVEVEMVSGQFGHSQLVGDNALPEYTARRDEFSGRFCYSFGDEELRLALPIFIDYSPQPTYQIAWPTSIGDMERANESIT